MKLTNLGVQIFPVVLLVISYLYVLANSKMLAGFCFVLALAMWLMLWSENKKI